MHRILAELAHLLSLSRPRLVWDDKLAPRKPPFMTMLDTRVGAIAVTGVTSDVIGGRHASYLSYMRYEGRLI